MALSLFSQEVISREQFLSGNVVVISETAGEEESRAFFACLSGSVEGVWYPTDSYLVCPGYGMVEGRETVLGNARIKQRVAPSSGVEVKIPWVVTEGTNYWMAVVASRGFRLWFDNQWCADRFSVVSDSAEETGKWEAAMITFDGQRECLPLISGEGNVVVYLSPYSVVLKRTAPSDFAPPTTSQSVPSEVVGLAPVSFLPEPYISGWGLRDLMSLVSGGLLLWLSGLLSKILLGKPS